MLIDIYWEARFLTTYMFDKMPYKVLARLLGVQALLHVGRRYEPLRQTERLIIHFLNLTSSLDYLIHVRQAL